MGTEERMTCKLKILNLAEEFRLLQMTTFIIGFKEAGPIGYGTQVPFDGCIVTLI